MSTIEKIKKDWNTAFAELEKAKAWLAYTRSRGGNAELDYELRKSELADISQKLYEHPDFKA